MITQPAPDAWREEDWARRVAGLGLAERARRLSAAKVLLQNEDDISDVLYSELVILREALEGDTPEGEASAGGDCED